MKTLPVKMLKALIWFANHPYTMIAAGIFLSLASAWELGEGLLSFDEGLRGEHGAFIYGLMSTLKGLGSLGEVEEGVVVIRGAKALEKAKQAQK